MKEKRYIKRNPYSIEDGIKDIRLNLRSFGEEEPNYSDLPISEREKNRRVKISINKDN